MTVSIAWAFDTGILVVISLGAWASSRLARRAFAEANRPPTVGELLAPLVEELLADPELRAVLSIATGDKGTLADLDEVRSGRLIVEPATQRFAEGTHAPGRAR